MGKFADFVRRFLKEAENGKSSVAWMDAGTPGIQVGAQSPDSSEYEENKRTKKSKQGFLGGIDSVSNISL